MGCVKSKGSEPTQNTRTVEMVDGKAGRKREDKPVLMHSEVGLAEERPQVNLVLLDYAQRLAKEIVSRAVQQWADVDSRYSDIPYIECDVS